MIFKINLNELKEKRNIKGETMYSINKTYYENLETKYEV